MAKERRPLHASGTATSRAASVALVAVGAALLASTVLLASRLRPVEIATFSAFAVAAIGGGLVLARLSGLFRNWSWSGRSWSELLTPGGPVRSPFEWIRVGIATFLGSILLLLVAFGVCAGVGWLDAPSVGQAVAASDASFEQGVALAVGILAMLVGLAAVLLAAFAVVSLAVGVIGLGLRSGASSMSLRDWVSMDKRT